MPRKVCYKQLLSFAVRIIAVLILVMILPGAAQTPASQTGKILQREGTFSPPLQHQVQQSGRPGRQVRHSQNRRSAARSTDSDIPLFSQAVLYSPGDGAHSVVAADLNGDHKPDVVVANSSGIAVLLGKGEGTLQPAVMYSGTAGTVWWPQGLKVVDLNGDHFLDVVIANAGGGSDGGDSVGVWMGNGDGTFQPEMTYDSAGTGNIFTLALTDVNLDGKTDIILSNPNSGPARNGTVTLLLGNGDGTFQPARLVLQDGCMYGGCVSIAVADLNKDGKPDLIVGGYPSNLSVFLGYGDGSFQFFVNYDSGSWNCVTVADLNADGNPDVIVGGAVLLGNGDGTLQPAITFPYGGFSITVADVNDDGKPDLLVPFYASYGSSQLGVLVGNGDGTFQDPLTYDTGAPRALSVDVADLNGDGKPDALVAEACSDLWERCGTGVLSVLLQANSTTTGLVSSLNPSVFGQAIEFTASVRSGFGTPTGTVALLDASTELVSQSLANGTAVMSVSSLSAGSHNLTASYEGAPGYSPSSSNSVNQIVNVATTAISLASSLNPVPLKEYVTYTATMTSQYGGAVTGTVVFQDGGSTVATVDLIGGEATFRTNYTALGTHNITAAYLGDANSVGSTSAILIEQIIRGLPSKVVLTTSGSPTLVGQPVTFTAKVTSLHGTIPDGELVTFYDGLAIVGSMALTGGTAGYTSSSLSAKKHTIKAYYAGDATFQPSTGIVLQTVLKHETTTALTSIPNPSGYGQSVTFTATVTSAGPAPTGKVRFEDGTTGIGTIIVSGGVATLTKSKLAAGTHPIRALYLGDAASAKSTSSVLNQVVE